MNKLSLRYALGALLAIVFLYLAFRGTDIASFLTSLQQANYWWILVMFGCLIASHLIRAWRWRYLLEPIKPRIAMRSLVSGVMVGYMVNNVLPRAGELVRPYAIGKLEGISKSAAFGTVIVERIIDTVAFLVLIALVPLVYDGPLRETFPWLDNARFVASVATASLVALIVVMIVRQEWTDRLVGFGVRIVPRRFAPSVERLTHQFLQGFLFLKQPRHYGIILLQSVAIWWLYICMVYVAFFAYDLHLAFGAALVVQAISSIGVAIPTPGGTGSYHVFASQSLNKLFGVDSTVALSYATVTHGFGYIGMMIVGSYFFVKDHIRVSDAVGNVKENAS